MSNYYSKSDYIDLRKRFGHCYRIEHELGGRRIHDPWDAVILCRHGHIYPYGEDLLGASTNHQGSVAKRLATLDCVAVHQDGDDGINVVFRVDYLREVARIIKPRSVRRLSAAHRRKLMASNKHSRFSNGSRDAGEALKTHFVREPLRSTVGPMATKRPRRNHKRPAVTATEQS